MAIFEPDNKKKPVLSPYLRIWAKILTKIGAEAQVWVRTVSATRL